jgi:translation initiation factor eIF-2B subunit gamma
MDPLCRDRPKALLPLCNRPLLWFVLKPFVDSGCRSFYICAHETGDELAQIRDYLHKCPTFTSISFHFVPVPTHVPGGGEDDRTDSADAIRAYLKYIRDSRMADRDGNATKDFLVVPCDLILSHVDLTPFVTNFYRQVASAAVVLLPTTKEERAKNGEADDRCVVVLETPSSSLNEPHIEHQRLFLHSPGGFDASLDLSVGYLVRRPDILFDRTLTDPHLYLFRSWVADFVVQAPDIRSIREELISVLCDAQLWKVGGEGATSSGPSERLSYKIPPHWLTGGQGTKSLLSLNSMQNNLPSSWDEVIVTATTIPAHPLHRIIRVNSKEKYKHLSEEIVVSLLNPIHEVSSPVAALVIRELKAEFDHVVAGRSTKVKGCALLTAPPPDAKVGRSVVGSGVKIGASVKIQKSILMDRVEIRDGVSLTDCIVCPGVVLGPDRSFAPPPKSSFLIITPEMSDERAEESEASDQGDEFQW